MLLSILLLPLLAADAKPAPVDKDELKKLQGTWTVSRREHGGEADDAKKVKGLRVVFADTKWTVRDGDDTADTGVITALNARAKPAEITMKVTSGDDKGKEVRGIYQFEKKTLTVCFAEPDKPRPTKFEAAKGTGHTVLVLEKK